MGKIGATIMAKGYSRPQEEVAPALAGCEVPLRIEVQQT